ncbi:ABC transporter ATP-binding protein [Pinisolibacter aquiterrae]|jgi:putrescine transport system ATP-binding protein|uniref:ABC transporter ATP-binding protein n=1 Tax=Pinisolibacter aquiterrae TaxID=2815579 RepID=UPI001C3DCD67|nr:ABC transporter ATP-binding protein [Pinisolibacter aquiterrae]MBV5263470.1 ABC transporter ATP-binding protein [Pinisolibacter aquiterrae]MCC8237453.1 ABC transporter ATP-binding protein [Pinisolibacter aquiterrae]
MAKTLGPVRRKFSPWNDPTAKPLIEFRNVVKRFGDFTAVDDVSLGIYEREFFALLGPSGCGKTTLMRMLAGFEHPSEGEIRLAGASLAGKQPYERPVNMMFQSYALFPHMSVEKNIAFGLVMDKMPKGEIETRVQEMLKLVKLEKFAKRKPHQLSGGQRQRVALARSLAKRPKVLLLDEPLGALDKKLREETQFELMDLQQELGMTFLIVTHDQEEAMTVADRIAVMDHGKLIQVAGPSEIYEQPNSRYVADFIGDINIVEGRVTAIDGGLIRMEAAAPRVSIVMEDDAATSVGATAWMAVRPEKVRISHDAPIETGVNAVHGEVWDIGYIGDTSVYHVKLDDGGTFRAAVANVSRTVERPIGWDDRVWLTWSKTAGVVLTA